MGPERGSRCSYASKKIFVGRLSVGATRTKTDTGRRVENTKVIERTIVKELGKMAS